MTFLQAAWDTVILPTTVGESRKAGALRSPAFAGEAGRRRCEFALSPLSERLWTSHLALQTSAICSVQGGEGAEPGGRAGRRPGPSGARRTPENFAPSADPGAQGPGAPSAGARRRRSSFPLHVTGAARPLPPPAEGATPWEGAAEVAEEAAGASAGAEGPESGEQREPPPGLRLQPRGPPRSGLPRSLS